MKAFNPSHRPSPKAQRATKRKYIKWINWLKKNEAKGYVEKLNKLESDYHKRIAEINAQFPYYLRKNNLRDLSKEFDLPF